MRTLHVYSGNLYGGIETLLATLARERTACPEMEPEFALCFGGRLEQELKAAGAKTHLLGGVRVRYPWTIAQARCQLDRLLACTRFDVALMHGCWPHSLFAPIARGRKVRLAFWLHDYHKGTHWLERWSRRTVPDVVLANSEYTSKSAANLFPRVPTRIVRCPVAPPHLPRRAEITQAVRSELGTSLDATVIIQSSRLEAWKGHRLLIEALGKLHDMPHWECWIAGGPQRAPEHEYLRSLKTQANALGIADRVKFLGQRSDVSRLLRAADIHCQPNLSPEPFGIAFIEALYAGLPIVTTRMGGPLEIVNDDCGALVLPDSNELASELRRMILNPEARKRMGKAGPARAQQLCDTARQVQKICEALK